jgi:hypothetical protein
MDDGTVVKTENATQLWEEERKHDGRNLISTATGSQWEHQQLYRSRKGRYWLECWSQWQGSRPHAEWISNRSAAQWLLTNGHCLPEDLAALEEEVSE